MSMEDYMGQIRENNNTSGGGGGDGGSSSSFLYGGSGVNNNNNLYGRSSEGGFQYPVVKIESQQKFHDYPMTTIFQNEDEALKAKIISHPHYSNLLQAYMDCQKVGAPPEIAGRLTAVRQEYEARQQQRAANLRDNDVYKDPELDQFMEAYYDMLIKYKEELTRPLQEAMEFMRRIESQLSTLTISSSSSAATDHDHPRLFVSPGRAHKSRIEAVNNENGVRFEGQQVADQFVQHFQNFLGVAVPVQTMDFESLNANTVSNEDANNMIYGVTDMEVKEALFDICDNKAPGRWVHGFE